MKTVAWWMIPTILAAAADGADWPTYRSDAARSGYTTESLPDELQHLWSFRAVHPPMPAWPTRSRQRFDVVDQPVVAGGRVYFGSSADCKVYALDAATGRSVWHFYTAGPIRFAPVFWNGRIYVAGDDGYLYCLNASDGNLVWKLRAGPRNDRLLGNDRMISRWPIRGGPVIAGGVLYFGAGIWPTEGVFVYAVDPLTGKILWCDDSSGSMEIDQPHPTARAKSGIAAQGYLAVQGETLFVTSGRAVPALFERSSGRFRSFPLQVHGQLGGADVVVVDGQFYNTTAAFALDGGDRIGRVGTVVAAHPDFVLTTEVNKLVALDRRNLVVETETTDRKGRKKRTKVLAPPAWTLDLPEGFGLAPVERKGTETPADNRMSSTEWTRPSVAGQPGAMIVAGDQAVLGGQGRVILVDLNRRVIVWTAEVEGAACGLAVADGRLHVSTDRGMIYGFGKGTAAMAADPSAVSPLVASERVYSEAVEEILAKTGIVSGYCLDLGCGDGRLALELARRSELVIFGVEKDPAKVQAARQLLDRAGLYGARVVIHEENPADCGYPDYFADLIVSGRSVVEGSEAIPAASLEKFQRPFGGVACLGPPGAMRKTVRGPLAGSGRWTHQNTDAANSFCSDDKIVRGPLEMLWFRDTDLVMSNRHGRGPAPLVDGGRMFVEGLHALRAVNIYNGQTLWEFPLENVLLTYHREHSIGAAWAGSNYCLADGSVFVHTGNRCLRLDASSGRQMAEYLPPPRPDGKPGTWTYIACDGDTLCGSLADEEYLVRCWSPNWDTGGQFVQSVMLFAMDAESGKLKWTYTPKHSIRNNAIAVSGDRVYLIDRPAAEVDRLDYPLADVKARAKRRAAEAGTSEKGELLHLTEQPPGRLIALDGRTGATIWSVDKEIFGTSLAVSRQHGVILMSYQPAHQANLDSERGDRMAAFTIDGKRLWDVKAEYVARPILNDRTIYAEPGAWDLLTGRPLPFQLDRSYGCGIPCGSTNLLLFRSATLGYIDLTRGSQTENYGGIRPGCWFNAIPAGGLVLMPDAASWCTCSYLNQATVALKPARLTAGDLQERSKIDGQR